MLEAADTHILFDENLNEIFVKDCIPGETFIITKDGPELVTEVTNTYSKENMYDISVNSDNHRYYTNDILSHNTTSLVVFILWYLLFTNDKTVALLANKEDTAKEILGRVHVAYMYLPLWLQQGVVEWNKKTVSLENGSRCIAASTSSSAIRGYSVDLLMLDEAAYIENWEEFSQSVIPTISSRKSGKIVLISTPKGLNHFYNIYNGSLTGKNSYKPIKISWQDVPGRDETWRQEQLSALGGDEDKFAQEYSGEFLGSSGTLIAGWKLKELSPAIPLRTDLGLSQYEMPQKDRKYICVVDVGRGKGLDYSAFQLVDITEMPFKQVAVFRSNMVTSYDYASIIYTAAKAYNNAYVLVETNDIGAQVSDILHYDYEYEYILYTQSGGKYGKKISTGFRAGAERGIKTSKQVKSVGCSMLKLLVEQNQLIINDENTISELSTFSQKHNSYEAEAGCHDDLVMCLVLLAWASSQDYFKELVDYNTIQKLRDRTNQELDETFTPFGFISSEEPDGEVSDGLYWENVDQDQYYVKIRF